MDDDTAPPPSVPELLQTDEELTATSRTRGLDPFLDALWEALQPYRTMTVDEVIARLAENPDNRVIEVSTPVPPSHHEYRYKEGHYQQFERRLYPDDDPRHADRRPPFREIPNGFTLSEFTEVEERARPVEHDLWGRIPIDPHFGCARQMCTGADHREGRA